MKDELEHHRRIKKLSDYEAIGTVEEFKALKEEVELYRNLDKTNFSDGYNRAIDEFYDEILNFEDYIEPVDTSDFGAVLLYSGIDITNMIVKIKEQLKAGGINE